MKLDDLYQIAEQCWDGRDSCTEQDKKMWIDGFVSGVLKFADIESLPSPSELEEIGRKMGEKFKNMVGIPPDYNQLITENFKDLI
jgi:hypothetical protein